ncbi:Regulator of protease activity HflC, stomatin/prohibitin superfamily [Jiangella alba]|uniref:Regulator of protease activity HflC, stomatin/prohibitin superfamily n=1 Tax=Jiangella alba TaxID=561176 RepID=A0A1H5KKU3_9ACTN|nr:SPFH domain-containing protein [Jiangella alba]SEE65047.1 Regulator of protease activity HflC, stomatin/prohibitin superfamily [Jiangella alba]
MEAGQIFVLLVVILLAIFVLVTLAKSVRIVPQARAGIVERLGRYQRTLDPGLTVVVPFIDRVLPLLDLREQVVSFPPQPVITQDNLVVSIDTVIYYQVNDPKAATYEIANYIQGIEQLTVTTLRNVIGGMDLERTLTSREEINNALRGVLDDATGKWGIRVNRVELKAIDPPPSIQDSMEKQMRADRDKRAAILNAEGVRQSQILTAEGQKQSAILTAEGDKQSTVLRAEAEKQAQILRADGEAKAIGAVFDAIHRGNPDQKLLAYQYLQMMPEIAKGDSNKVWIVPSEFGKALEGLGDAVGRFGSGFAPGAIPADDNAAEEIEAAAQQAAAEGEAAAAAAAEEVRRALEAAEVASDPTKPLPPAEPDVSRPDDAADAADDSAADDATAGDGASGDERGPAGNGANGPALGRDLTQDPGDEPPSTPPPAPPAPPAG